jgi:hypothetical protein
MSQQQQFHEQVTQMDIQRDVERVIEAAQTKPISPNDAALLRWAVGLTREENKHANS